ncbi:hypothetical protein [Martelella mediterranea]|uniref:Uncharacterized protein n=1 Tax=Martelella mediterranea TaxID=293089 RepID=A0A4R3NYL8_9HYPH|nr:hypothetical protein [Martelella mediterranea]TCT45065.1 hypothetical protein EDC90_1001206 [Martelella mediterranea]
MADFTSVIRRAVEGLPESTPEMRARVYEKARAAVIRQMENMNPKPPEALVKRQIDKIDTAIAEVEAEFAEALPPEEPDDAAEPASDNIADVEDRPDVHEDTVRTEYDDREQDEPDQQIRDEEPVDAPEPQNHRFFEPHDREVEQQPEPLADAANNPSVDDEADEYEHDRYDYRDAGVDDRDDFTRHDDATDEAGDDAELSDDDLPRQPSGSSYGALRQSTFEIVGRDGLRDEDPAIEADVSDEPEDDAGYHFETPDDVDTTGQRVSFGDGEEHFNQEDEDDRAPRFEPAPPPPRRPVPEKDWAHVDSLLGLEPEDQLGSYEDYDEEDDDVADNKGDGASRRRLVPALIGLVVILVIAVGGYFAWTNMGSMRDLVAGSSQPADTEVAETDTPAPGGDAAEEAGSVDKPFTQRLLPDGTEVVEGLPAAGSATGPARTVASRTAAASDSATPSTSSQEAADPAPPVGAGQLMYLYEEQLGQSVPSSFEGSVEWELKQENNGTAVSEPVIEGTMNVPDVGLKGTITFRRNDDPSLPASHLVDVSFELSDNFEGGAIDNVQRMSLKNTEASRGDPLVAVSAKITDDLYMLALNDYQQARKQNMTLLRDRNWIDIPVTYRNGRRALLTLEKGTTGMAIFDRAIQEWQALGDINDGN